MGPITYGNFNIVNDDNRKTRINWRMKTDTRINNLIISNYKIVNYMRLLRIG